MDEAQSRPLNSDRNLDQNPNAVSQIEDIQLVAVRKLSPQWTCNTLAQYTFLASQNLRWLLKGNFAWRNINTIVASFVPIVSYVIFVARQTLGYQMSEELLEIYVHFHGLFSIIFNLHWISRFNLKGICYGGLCCLEVYGLNLTKVQGDLLCHAAIIFIEYSELNHRPLDTLSKTHTIVASGACIGYGIFLLGCIGTIAIKTPINNKLTKPTSRLFSVLFVLAGLLGLGVYVVEYCTAHRTIPFQEALQIWLIDRRWMDSNLWKCILFIGKGVQIWKNPPVYSFGQHNQARNTILPLCQPT